VNSKFPFRKEIARSYQTIVEKLLCELIDPCLEAEDKQWACAVARDIFTPTQNFARGKILEPQSAFKKSVMAGDGEDEVAEWEPARVFMCKLQRVTRGRILASSMEKTAISAWLDDIVRNDEKGALSRLVKHKEYNGSIEKCCHQLVQVSFTAMCRLIQYSPG
jgi:hypothetical protein